MTSQTVSLEIAKQLKEVGWSKRCLYAYETSPLMRGSTFIQDEDYKSTSYKPSHVQAPMLHEILEELPKKIIIDENEYLLSILYHFEGDGEFEVAYMDELFHNYKFFSGENPQDTCALLWLWAVKEGYITLNQQPMTNKLQALISKHRVLLEYNPVLPTNVVDVLIESFQDSLLEYARYVVPAPDTETIYDEDSQMGGWEQCIKEINNTILEDELSLGEEDTLNNK